MILPDSEEEEEPPQEKKVDVKKFSSIEELSGKLKTSDETKKLLKSVMENDQDVIDEGKLIKEAYNQGMSSFTPSTMFEQFVKNFSLAKQLYGETIIRLLSGYDPSYIEKNISVPEFQKLVKKAIEEKINQLKKNKVLGKDNEITETGSELAMIIMAAEELENIIPKGYLGERVSQRSSLYGEKGDYKIYKKGTRYRDIAVKRSVKTAIRRGHSNIEANDLRAFDMTQKGKITVIYAIDSSGSMRGNKIDAAKRAGVALAYKAINEKDKVGLIVFGDEIKDSVPPTEDFTLLLKKLTKIRTAKETNMVLALKKASELFTDNDSTNHLIILTDVLPTAGEMPEKETLDAAAEAGARGITVSIVGVSIDKKGEELGRKIAELGKGKFYLAKNTDDIDKIILEDYGSYI